MGRIMADSSIVELVGHEELHFAIKTLMREGRRKQLVEIHYHVKHNDTFDNRPLVRKAI